MDHVADGHASLSAKAAIKNLHHRRHTHNRPTAVSPAGGIMAPDPLRNQAIPVPLGIEIECTQVSPWMRVERNAPSAMCRIAPELRECSGDK